LNFARRDYEQATKLYQRALAIREKVLGPEHRAVAQSLRDLGDLYRVEGRYADAEPLFQRALAICEKILGKDHPEVAAVLESYALLLRATGRPTKAEELEAQAKSIRANGSSAVPSLVASKN
jgi:tetratricopeptide (TPR) repeat protein